MGAFRGVGTSAPLQSLCASLSHRSAAASSWEHNLFVGAQFSHSDPCNVLSNTLQELAPREGSVFFKMGRVHRRLNQVRCSSSERHSQILCNVPFSVERGFVLICKSQHQLRRHSIRSLSAGPGGRGRRGLHVTCFQFQSMNVNCIDES